MSRIINSLCFAAVLLVASASLAATASSMQCKTSAGSTTLLNGVALNAADASTRTITCGLGRNYSKLLVSVYYTYVGATAVTAQLKCALNSTYAVRQTRSCSSGTCTLYDMTDSKPASTSNQLYQVELDVSGCNGAQVVFGGTGGGLVSGDVVSVEATAVN